MAKKTTTNQEDLIGSLKDRREASAYLNAAMEKSGYTIFLLALRNVVKAHGGMTAVAEKARLSRENLYQMLSEKGNPELKSLLCLLQSMGLKLAIAPKGNAAKSSNIRDAA